MDSWAFMQLSPFVRCNSHWVRGFFPVDDGETLKDAKATGAYKYMDILNIEPNYTERELKGLSRDQEVRRELSGNKVWRDHYSKSVPFRHKFAKIVKRRKEQSRDREYIDGAWLRLDIETWEAAEAEDRADDRARRDATEPYSPTDEVREWRAHGRWSSVAEYCKEMDRLKKAANVTGDDCEAIHAIHRLVNERFSREMAAACTRIEIEVAWIKYAKSYKAIPVARSMVEKGLVDATPGEIYETHL